MRQHALRLGGIPGQADPVDQQALFPEAINAPGLLQQQRLQCRRQQGFGKGGIAAIDPKPGGKFRGVDFNFIRRQRSGKQARRDPRLNLYRGDSRAGQRQQAVGKGRSVGSRIADPERELVATTEHPFWCETLSRWKSATELIPGDQLLMANGDTATVIGSKIQLPPYDELFTVYNFRVKEFHSYFVSPSTAAGGYNSTTGISPAHAVVVHNANKEYNKGVEQAKRGPKTDPDAPHNKKIREEGAKLESEGNTIVAGGGKKKERLVATPGGKKEGRRPDILYETPEGDLRGRNVGRTKADSSPATREQEALDDLNDRGNLPTDYVPYDR